MSYCAISVCPQGATTWAAISTDAPTSMQLFAGERVGKASFLAPVFVWTEVLRRGELCPSNPWMISKGWGCCGGSCSRAAEAGTGIFGSTAFAPAHGSGEPAWTPRQRFCVSDVRVGRARRTVVVRPCRTSPRAGGLETSAACGSSVRGRVATGSSGQLRSRAAYSSHPRRPCPGW